MIYKVADGFDIALLSLVTVDPQPKSTGIQYGRINHSASGVVYGQTPYIELIWTVLESESQYTTLLGQFGLTAALSNGVTVYIPNDQLTATRYNGIAIRPNLGDDAKRDNFFVREVVIRINHLEVAE